MADTILAVRAQLGHPEDADHHDSPPPWRPARTARQRPVSRHDRAAALISHRLTLLLARSPAGLLLAGHGGKFAGRCAVPCAGLLLRLNISYLQIMAGSVGTARWPRRPFPARGNSLALRPILVHSASSGLMNPSLIRSPWRADRRAAALAQWCSMRTSAAAESFSRHIPPLLLGEHVRLPAAQPPVPAAAPASMPSSPSMPRRS